MAEPKVPQARALAWEILRRVENEGAYADVLLGNRLGASGLPPRDRALVTRLVYGTLAWQGYLDHIIAAFVRRPASDLEAPVRSVLRLALLQICVLTKVPPFAAVDTAVELAKQIHRGTAAGLVNAVLRRAAAGWRQVPLPARTQDPIGYLSVRLSHPRWLVERWVAEYGVDDTEALLLANNEAAPTVLRVNRLRTGVADLLADWQTAGYAARRTTYSPAGILLEDGGDPEGLPAYKDGLVSAQGEASQLVGFLASPQPGMRILDACAAPGGKATHLAELMDNRGAVVALDIHARGVARISRMAQRLGLSVLHPEVADATAWKSPDGSFDGVVVDAPCSGLGTLREHPEVKWRRNPESLRALADLQLRLLRHLSPLVRGGGAVVYATCTLSREENDEVVAAFLRAHPEFAVEDPRPLLPQSACKLIGSDNMLRTFPQRHGLDGFFAVRLKRQSARGIVAP